jgi:hypothetical protein
VSGSRFPWLPVLALAAATVWAAAGSGAAPSRDGARGWDAPVLLAQVAPGGTDEGEDTGEDEADPSDTLGVEEDEPLTSPDTTGTAPSQPDTATGVPPRVAAPADTTVAVPDTSRAAVTDTLRGTLVPAGPDSAAAAARRAAAADSGVGDTLYLAKPRTQPQAGNPPPAQTRKPRTGILGIHPIVILLGVAALHYFVVKSTGD